MASFLHIWNKPRLQALQVPIPSGLLPIAVPSRSMDPHRGLDAGFWWVLTIMPTVPRASNSVTLLPHFLRVWDRNNISDDLMARYDWEAVAETSCLYYYV